MKKFEEPMIKVIGFKTADVITTSGISEPIFDHDNARTNANDIAKLEDFFTV